MLVRLGVARQHLLRERRAVVRAVRLGADDGDLAVVPEAAQLLDRTQARERRADDDDAIAVRRASSRHRADGTPELARSTWRTCGDRVARA